MSGSFVFIHKPIGITSFYALKEFKSTLPKGAKVGHHGSLDPFASGLLLVAIDEACKFISYVDDSKKTYEATLRLGQKTNSLDLTGEVIQTQAVTFHQKESTATLKNKIQEVLNTFLGETSQIPPMHSAIKINGVALYKRAHKGQEVERAPRSITIFDINLIDFYQTTDGFYEIRFRVVCSRGTYIRVLAEDVAQKLGELGHLTQLARTELCGFSLKEFSQNLNPNTTTLVSPHLSSDALLNHYPKLDLTAEEKEKLYQGKTLPNLNNTPTGFIRLYLNQTFLGLGQVEAEVVKVKRLVQCHSQRV